MDCREVVNSKWQSTRKGQTSTLKPTERIFFSLSMRDVDIPSTLMSPSSYTIDQLFLWPIETILICDLSWVLRWSSSVFGSFSKTQWATPLWPTTPMNPWPSGVNVIHAMFPSPVSRPVFIVATWQNRRTRLVMGSFPGFFPNRCNLRKNVRRAVVETCLLFTESVRRNQSPSFATETFSIFSFLECASLIAVTRSGGEVLVLVLNELTRSNLQATCTNHHVDEPDEATHPGEDSDKKEKHTMVIRRVEDEARSIGFFAATLSMGLCSWM